MMSFRKVELMLRTVMVEYTVQNFYDVLFTEHHQACIPDARKPQLSETPKNVDMKYHYIIDSISNGI